MGGEAGLDTQNAPMRVVVACEGDGVPGVRDADHRAGARRGPRSQTPHAAAGDLVGGALGRGAEAGQPTGLADSLADSNRALAAVQAKLTEAQSMARLGEMTAGAAHEMNNPLTVIRGRSSLLASR